jgi:hypothetical protein
VDLARAQPFMLLFYALSGLSVAAWTVAVWFYFRAARSAKPGTPWRIRGQPLYLILKPEVWSPESRHYWRQYLLWLVAFAACIGLMFALHALVGLPSE